MNKKKPECIDCYKVSCKQCSWVATEEEVLQIREEKLIACPQCGWKPGTSQETV